MRQHVVQGFRIAVRGFGEWADIADAGSDVVRDPQGGHHMDAPGGA